MKTKSFILLLIALFCFTGISAQKKDKIVITGTVKDAAKKPIQNAMIMIDNQKTNSVTDANGAYKIKVKASAVRISVVTFGLGLKEEDISGRTNIDFVFGGEKLNTVTESNIPSSETSVSEGYSNVKKKNTISDEYIKDPKDRKKTYSSIYEMLQEVPGVAVSGSTVNIRDSKNLWGSIPPLFVVDGVYVEDLSSVSPTQVESISVLKGASAAMYGSRGYGGVIVVKTKKIDIDKK